ncbi:DUF302 domain-containing protein [Marixanthomonas ophiurae]|uniref:DUF302 domain-containing protein n=1 Tax=Marixanthomonas ophiurae TaxID=387659 RepID=A0A3E1QC84_9FLAO|nr:DUF302 domain-containing protein [Marixanthomonas ophiurae]RFN59751.1 DUF302 domain-containing protein [Marixanthomonas ophiurae]
MKKLLILALAITTFACSNDDNNAQVINNPQTPGLAYAVSDSDFTTTYSLLRSELQANPNISIIAEVNHTANAESIDKDLRNTRVIFFGNPALGTPLMQQNQLAGLDLPQKMLVYQDSDNNVFVSYNGTEYLAARHSGVGGAQTLQQIKSALANFTESATNGNVSENSSSGITNKQGIITLVSNNDFNSTYNNLRNAVVDNAALTLFAELNHQENAPNEEDLNPTRVIIFGNPELGTPLMQNAQTTAIDLPQKMLVWQEEDGQVNISYNDPIFFKERHGITNNDERLGQIKSALNNLAIDAAN